MLLLPCSRDSGSGDEESKYDARRGEVSEVSRLLTSVVEQDAFIARVVMVKPFLLLVFSERTRNSLSVASQSERNKYPFVFT